MTNTGQGRGNELLLPDRRLQQRDYLLRIAQAMTARLDLREVLAIVIRYAVDITGGRAGAIAMRQGDGTLKPVASYRLEGVFEERLEDALQSAPGRPGNRPPGASVSDSAPVAGMPALEGPRPEASRRERIVSLPLELAGEEMGRIIIFRSEAAAVFSPLDSRVLQAFADQAAVAIHNARLYARLAVQANELRLLHDFTLALLGAEGRSDGLSAAAGHILGVGPSDWAAVVPLGSGEAVTAAANGFAEEVDTAALALMGPDLAGGAAPVVFGDLASQPDAPAALAEAHLGSAAAAPVDGTGGPVAVLWVAARAPRRYGKDTVPLLETFARTLGLAVDRYGLVEELAGRQAQLAAIIEGHPSGILLLDRDLGIRAANPAAARLVGRGTADLAGRPLDTVMKVLDEAGRSIAAPRPTASAGEAATIRGTLDIGEAPYVQLSLTPLARTGGQATAYLAEVVDLSAYKEAEDAKRVFLAGLSHEQKTPLALIRGYAETLAHEEVRRDDALFTDSLEVILTETQHLTRMVDRLLLAARLQSGELTLDVDDVDLVPLVQRLVGEFNAIHPDHRWTFEGSGAAIVAGDGDRLREVIGNLLSNAAKFSPAGTAVAVAVESTGGQAVVTVTDGGIGIEPRDAERVFERFFRASNRVEGAGLGLYMSRAIVEAHGGTLALASEPGRGSRFTVALPLRPSAASRVAPEVSEARP
ncbi:MAG: ATP-binding protein [Anaerolineae bacterium]